MLVGYDLDGVGYDFGASVRAYLDSIGMVVPEIVYDKWDFYDYWGMTREEFTQICHDGADAGFIFGGKAEREGFAEATQLTHMLGHKNIVITDRSFGMVPEVSQGLTKAWLADIAAVWDEIYFSPDKTCVLTDMFVEDKIENYDALDAAGVEVYLIDRPWNQCEDDRRRIESVSEYAAIVYKKTPDLILI